MGLTPTLRATRVAMRRTWARVQVVWGGAIEQHGRICERTCAVGKLSRTWTSGFASLLVGGHRSSLLFPREAISQAARPAVRSCRHIERCSHRDLCGTAIRSSCSPLLERLKIDTPVPARADRRSFLS